ncbi:MAG: Zn-ribbon containing protein [Methanobacteriota archaeon]
MPHVCIRCKTKLTAAAGLAPRCPECGGTKFSFESDKRKRLQGDVQVSSETGTHEVSDINQEIEKVTCTTKEQIEPSNPDPIESIESIRILEPGKYDLNLLRLADSDDRVIRVGKDGNYRLDLHSMVRPKKKR